MVTRYKKIQVIINPAAGKDEPILNTLNDVFKSYDIEWDVSLTHKFGDATRLAKQAVAAGVDLVAGYGGDGTQMEVATGMIGSNVPMAILPGGTGNAMAFDLKVPRVLRQAAELICASQTTRKIDVGQIGERYFMLRVYTGPDEDKIASRDEKDKYGLLAYPMASLRVMQNLADIDYTLTIDGQRVEDNGFLCLISNTGSPGGIPLPENKHVNPSDGWLDVFMINKTVRSLTALASYRYGGRFGENNIHHWQGKEITIEANPPQPLWIDGEAQGTTPATITLIPKAVEIVVP